MSEAGIIVLACVGAFVVIVVAVIIAAMVDQRRR